MAWQVQHYGEFLDIQSRAWRVEISRDTDGEVEPSEVTFPADTPLEIERDGVEFEDAVWGSSATLRLVSDTDRRFIGLYTVRPGTIRMQVYREWGNPGSGNMQLVWTGMLDPEFYEEPYEMLQGYEVELTFTDFGILDRLKFDMGGLPTLRDMLVRAAALAGIEGNVLDYTSLTCEDGEPALTGLAVEPSNFTDEEGEVSTWREVLDGALQPLGLKAVQWRGDVLVYDWQGYHSHIEGGEPEVSWSGDSQTLGVGKVYNSVKVTFSPYARTEMLEDGLEYTDPYRATWWDYTRDNTGSHNGGQVCYSYHPDYSTGLSSSSDDDTDFTDLDFTMFVGAAEGAVIEYSEARFFHMLPVYGSADECTGVYYSFVAGQFSLDTTGMTARYGGLRGCGRTERVFTPPRFHVPAMPDGDRRAEFMLRLTQDILLDCRYNPFTDAGRYNESSNQSTLEGRSAFVFGRVSLTLYDGEEGGTALWHYDNSAVAQGDGTNRLTVGSWVSGEDADGPSTWLEWYNPEDLTDNAGGVGGWQTNRHCIGKPDGGGSREEYGEANAMLRNAPDGEFVPYPPEGGWLEVAVYNSVYGYRSGTRAAPGDGDSWEDAGVYDLLRWWLYRQPEVSVVRNDLEFADADLDDVEYCGTLDADAQDELGIDTVCGTADDAPPTARGVYRRTDGAMVTDLTRDGVTDRVEKLLIGQLHGQYAERRATLSGEAWLDWPEQLEYTERNQEGRLFLLTSQTMDIRGCTGEVELREIGQDTYIAD